MTIKCNKCGYDLIEEELLDHTCKQVVDYRIEKNILWLFDGSSWYPRKLLSAEKLQADNSNSSAEDDTEPCVWFSNVYGGLMAITYL
jgi:hypothetical protein